MLSPFQSSVGIFLYENVKHVGKIQGHAGVITGLQFSLKDPFYLLTSSLDGTVRLFNDHNESFPKGQNCSFVAIFPTVFHLASLFSLCRCWDLRTDCKDSTSVLRGTAQNKFTSLSLSSNGLLAAAGTEAETGAD